MPFLDSEHGAYFRRWDVASPRAGVLLLHGFGEHSGHYHRLAHHLGSAGIEVWGLDHVGHGLTGGERGFFGSVDVLAGNAEVLLEHIRAESPGLPLVIVGHSLGGITAATMLVRHATADALVLTGTPLAGLPDRVPDDPVMTTDPYYLDLLATDPLGFDTAPAEPALWAAIGDRVQEIDRGLQQIDVPTLLVAGDRDVFVPIESIRRAARLLPDAVVVEVPGGHHDIVNDAQHAEVEKAIGDFINARVAPPLGQLTPQ